MEKPVAMDKKNRLDLLENHIIQHIDDKVSPLVQDIRGMRRTLYGEDGAGGVVGDVRDMKTSVRIFKWIAGGGLGASLAKWLHGMF